MAGTENGDGKISMEAKTVLVTVGTSATAQRGRPAGIAHPGDLFGPGPAEAVGGEFVVDQGLGPVRKG